MAPERETIARPSRLLLALEGRAFLEAASLLPALPLLAWAPRGDGHPVLVLPGFLAGDRSTQILRGFLRDRGYLSYGWALGRNIGPTPEILTGLARRFAEIRDQHGRQVSLIGWSLGGIYARELARRFPADVRQVITLGSPFRNPSATNVSFLIQWLLSGRWVSTAAEIRERLRTPLSVPTTSIYSRSDGVVSWRSCVEEEGPLRENVEVLSSHVGMGYNPAVLFVTADRLAQPEGAWRPYSSSARRG
jgi:pimeloyl-ACP methyl ester carboxylesterase